MTAGDCGERSRCEVEPERASGLGRTPSQHDQPGPCGAGQGFGAARSTELVEDRADVELDRVLADPELKSDRLVGQALCDELEDLALSRREWLAGVGGCPRRCVGRQEGNGTRVQHREALPGGPQRRYDLV